MSNPFPRNDGFQRALHRAVGASSPLWTAVWFGVGLGFVGWCWSRVGRGLLRENAISSLPAPLGPSPEPARPSAAGRSGEAKVEIAAPELVMAHNPPPAEPPDHPAHPSDADIAEPPPEMLAHIPPESVGLSFKPGTGFENPTRDPDSAFSLSGGGEAGAHAGAASESDQPPAPAKASAPKRRKAKPSGVEEAAAAILANPPGEPSFDPEALATETSVAALTAGELSADAVHLPEGLNEGSGPQVPKPRSRRKPRAAPEA